MPDTATSGAAPLAASRCRIRRPRLYALASAGEFAAIAAALCKSEIVVVLKIESKLRGCRPKYFPKRTAVLALMARSSRMTSKMPENQRLCQRLSVTPA